jgi:hypothetical protein
MIHPAEIALPAEFDEGSAVAAEDFYEFFSARYGEKAISCQLSAISTDDDLGLTADS